MPHHLPTLLTACLLALPFAISAPATRTTSDAPPATPTAEHTPPAPVPIADLVALVDTDRLMATIRDLPPSRSSRGGDDNRRRLLHTESWLLDQLRAMGYEPEPLPIESADAPNLPDAPPHWRNIVVEIPTGEHDDAANPAPPQPRPVLVLSAHFDTVPGTPGADDDATGTAALLEIARILKQHEPALHLAADLRLIFFNLEESGLLGSRDYCARILRPRLDADRERVIGMVSLEMLGFFSDQPNSQGSPVRELPDGTPMPTVGDFIAIAGLAPHQGFSRPWGDAMRRHAPDLHVLSADFFPFPIPDILRSDHAPFLALNVPAVMLTDTANFRNPNYHRPSDHIDTLDPERFTLVVRAVLGAAVELARTPPPPPPPPLADPPTDSP